MDDDSYADTATEGVRMKDLYHHVSIRPREEFTEFRTPPGPEDIPSIAPTGTDIWERRLGPDTWVVQCVLIPRDTVESRARAERLAKRIAEERES